MEDFDNRLKKLESEMVILKEIVEKQVEENVKQNCDIKVLLKGNRRNLNSLGILIVGGIATTMLFMARIDLKTDFGQRAYERFEGRIFELLTLVVGGSTTVVYLNEKRKTQIAESEVDKDY